MTETETNIEAVEAGQRIDVFLERRYGGFSRGHYQRLIKLGKVTVNGKTVVPHYAVREGDFVIVTPDEQVKDMAAEQIPLDIVFEDNDIIAVNKAPGMVVHPACGHPSGTLMNALAGHAKGTFLPLMVHRLDKDTSGVILTAKNERAKNSLVKQFQNRAIHKTYLAAVQGYIAEAQGSIEAPLGRSPDDRKRMVVGPLADKMAVTEFTVTHRALGISLMEVHPVTGRTHQIRSHMAYIGHPVLGDVMYGGPLRMANFSFSRQMLHAWRIRFTHPGTGKTIEITAPPPSDISVFWQAIIKK